MVKGYKRRHRKGKDKSRELLEELIRVEQTVGTTPAEELVQQLQQERNYKPGEKPLSKYSGRWR